MKEENRKSISLIEILKMPVLIPGKYRPATPSRFTRVATQEQERLGQGLWIRQLKNLLQWEISQQEWFDAPEEEQARRVRLMMDHANYGSIIRDLEQNKDVDPPYKQKFIATRLWPSYEKTVLRIEKPEITIGQLKAYANFINNNQELAKLRMWANMSGVTREERNRRLKDCSRKSNELTQEFVRENLR